MSHGFTGAPMVRRASLTEADLNVTEAKPSPKASPKAAAVAEEEKKAE